MQKELKTKWIEALRSGEYHQATGLLRSENTVDGSPMGYCCLGVLCDVVDSDGWTPERDEWETAEGDVEEGGLLYFHKLGAESNGEGDTLLLTAWAEEQGLDPDLISELTSLNDGGNDFTFIADVIEAKVPVDA